MSDDHTRESANIPALRDGMLAAWPICLGYFPIGMALGVLAQKAGLGPAWIGLMSVLVFAGSAQFIAVAMIGGGASLASIVLATFIVNIRHVLMSSALAVPLGGVKRRFLLLFAYGITDESFGVNMARFRDGGWDRWRALVVHHTANATWIAATVLGGMAGTLIPEDAFGIAFALPAMFIALLVLQVRGRATALTGILAGTASVIWKLLIPGDSYIVGGAVIAATGGFFVRRSLRRRRGRAS